MYENIVKSLRHCAENDCSPECPRAGIGKGCIAGLKREAADAIEELSRLNAEITRRELKLRMSKPSWIPSKEHLPAYGEEVLTLGQNGGLDHGFFIGVASPGRPECWDWKKSSVKTVKYWMPRSALPPMPKEGKNGTHEATS